MNGFLVIDKETGFSSYDVIRRLKRVYTFRKIGYIGTLDRNATGILPVAINEGVKLIPFLEEGEKVYRGRLLLGLKTDTYDIKGRVIEEIKTEPFEKERIEEHLKQFKGKINQTIPPFSAKKIRGKPLYKWIKEGKLLELPLKEVEIYEIRLIGYTHPFVDIEVSCSKGTYVRSLAHDFGLSLGVGAVLYSLRRLKHGMFTEERAVLLDKIKSSQDIETFLMGVEEVFPTMKSVKVESNIERFIRHGMPYPIYGSKNEWKDRELVKFLDRNGFLIGIGIVDLSSNLIKVKRVLEKN